MCGEGREKLVLPTTGSPVSVLTPAPITPMPPGHSHESPLEPQSSLVFRKTQAYWLAVWALVPNAWVQSRLYLLLAVGLWTSFLTSQHTSFSTWKMEKIIVFNLWDHWEFIYVSWLDFVGTSVQFSSVQLLCCVQLFATPWSAACQASLSITNSQSLLKLVSIESVISSNHLILCRPLLFPSSIFPSIRVFSNE